MYIKKTNDYRMIPEGLKQVFQNDFTNNISKNELIKMRNEERITDRDLEIIKFLFKFKFATLKQIISYLQCLNIQVTEMVLRARLEKLIQYRVLNRFMFSDEKGSHIHIQSDALVIYCLDIGGKFILTNYSSEDTYGWSINENMRTSENISKNLMTVEFYLKILCICPNKLVYFNINPELSLARMVVSPSFEMCIKVNGEKKYFLGEFARDYDLNLNFRQKSIKFENILMTNAWKKYYFDTEKPPVLFIFADSDYSALKLGEITSSMTRIENYRLTTFDRFANLANVDDKNLSTKGTFLKYLPETKNLKMVNSKIFLPE